ncbi:MAG: tetratricopeptide repeat protein, partial [Candidatus Aminicenantaceae bacterium]
AYNVGEIFFSNQKIGQAITYFQKAVDINPDYSPAYLRMGYAYLNQNNTDSAKEYFEKFLELDPDSPEAPTVKNILSYLEK